MRLALAILICASACSAQTVFNVTNGGNISLKSPGVTRFLVKAPGGPGSFSDNFNRADGAIGSNWSTPAGDTAFTIASSQVQAGAEGFANNLSLWVGSTLTGVISNSVQITGSIVTAETYYGVVQCDINGNGGYLWANNSDAGLFLMTFTGGTSGSVLQSDATPVISGTVLAMVVRAGSIQCYTNGVLDFTYSGAATTGLLPGIYFTGNHNAPQDTMDNAAGAGGF